MANGNSTGPRGTNWTSTQAYTMAVLCLLVGLAAGYLVRGTSSSPAPATVPVAGSVPNLAAGDASQPVSPEQLRRMADAKAQPLLLRLKAEPNNAALLAEIGNIYYDTQQYPEAVRYYGDSLKADPANPNVRTDMATAYYYLGDADRALSEFENSLKYNPRHAQTLFNLGMVKWEAKMDASGALAAWQKLLESNPDYPERAKVEQLIAQVKQHQNLKPGARTNKPAN
jgi:cytochrome c-type biogenesis protein CcmH/NrfG